MIMKKIIKQNIPFVFKLFFIKTLYFIKSYKYRGDKFKCSVCNSNIKEFTPLNSICNGKFTSDLFAFGELHSVDKYETLNVSNFLCPVCGAQDKARLYALYFKYYFKQNGSKNKIKLIHFAPEGGLSTLFRANNKINYRSADLNRDDVDDLVDIRKMSLYSDSEFDVLICSHILEHIIEDNMAISELYRILKPGGWGIIMVPILLSLKATWEDATITSEEDRERYFGQNDHVRVYEKNDFINRLKNYGFSVEQLGIDFFGFSQFSKFGINNNSILYIVKK